MEKITFKSFGGIIERYEVAWIKQFIEKYEDRVGKVRSFTLKKINPWQENILPGKYELKIRSYKHSNQGLEINFDFSQELVDGEGIQIDCAYCSSADIRTVVDVLHEVFV